MSKKLNHHFVPQFYFRLFNGGQHFIHVLSARSGRAFLNAPIKGQCARHKFYGSSDVEDALGQIESHIGQVLRQIASRAAGKERWSLSQDEFFSVLTAALLQRSRTRRAVEQSETTQQAYLLAVFKEWAERHPDAELGQTANDALSLDQVRFRSNSAEEAIILIKHSLRSVPSVSDLTLGVLRNRTNRPFIFSDASAVAYNLQAWQVKHWGTLGLQQPGFMLLLPLTPTIQLLLYDGDAYRARMKTSPFVEVRDATDVDCLNCLQIHASHQNLYFADSADQQYVAKLLQSQRGAIRSIKPGFRKIPRGGVPIDGRPNQNEVLQMFEPQLDYQLRLSFIQTDLLSATDRPGYCRSEFLSGLAFSDLPDSKQLGPVSVDELMTRMDWPGANRWESFRHATSSRRRIAQLG